MQISLLNQTRPLFHWRNDPYFCQKYLDGFVSALSSPDVNWWTGVVWITCGLLWCFYQMFGLSFWRHPFTAEHPLLHFSKSDKETNSVNVSKCSANFHFWVNYSFNVISCLVNQSPDVKHGIMEKWLSAQTFLKVRSHHPSHHYYWHSLSSHLHQRWSQKRCFSDGSQTYERNVSLCLIWSCITHTSS